MKLEIPLIRYKAGEKPEGAWYKYFLRRIKQNKNNLVAVIGQTGSGKTWSAISICERLSKEMNVPFTVDNIIFGLKPLLKLINSGKLKSGSCIIFDEPQVSISSRDWQSKANKVFNFLVSTFRYQNLNMFFCTPYEDLLDKSTRKLFHAKLETTTINVKEKTVRFRPTVVFYKSDIQDFRYPYLRVEWQKPGKNKFRIDKVEAWDVDIPSKEMIKAYEDKRAGWHRQLTTNMDKEIEAFEKGGKPNENELKDRVKELVDKMGVKETAKLCKKSEMTIYRWLKEVKEKINTKPT